MKFFLKSNFWFLVDIIRQLYLRASLFRCWCVLCFNQERPCIFKDDKLKEVGIEQCSVLFSFLSKSLFSTDLCFNLN